MNYTSKKVLLHIVLVETEAEGSIIGDSQKIKKNIVLGKMWYNLTFAVSTLNLVNRV